jgi:hypothetical protein
VWTWYPRQDSNLRTWFRKPLLYPLSYGGFRVSISEVVAALRARGAGGTEVGAAGGCDCDHGMPAVARVRATKPWSTASSQTGRRGQGVRQASMVSA